MYCHVTHECQLTEAENCTAIMLQSPKSQLHTVGVIKTITTVSHAGQGCVACPGWVAVGRCALVIYRYEEWHSETDHPTQ